MTRLRDTAHTHTHNSHISYTQRGMWCTRPCAHLAHTVRSGESTPSSTSLDLRQFHLTSEYAHHAPDLCQDIACGCGFDERATARCSDCCHCYGSPSPHGMRGPGPTPDHPRPDQAASPGHGRHTRARPQTTSTINLTHIAPKARPGGDCSLKKLKAQCCERQQRPPGAAAAEVSLSSPLRT